jgi:hypothetical protein
MRVPRAILVFPVLATAFATAGRPGTSVDPVLRQYVEHEGFTWVSKNTKHFHLYFQRDSDARRRISILKRNAETDRDHVIHLIGETDYRPAISAFFLKSGEQMKDLVGAEVDGRSRPAQHCVFSVVTPARLHLTHEICHEIASNLWGAAEPWIEEGLAVYADEGDLNIYYDSWTLLNSDSLIPLDKLVSPEWQSTMYSPDITYTELGGFVKFLRDRYGIDRIKQIWQAGSRDISRVCGKSLAQLDAEWRESLVSQFPHPPTHHYRSVDLGFRIE